MPLIPPTARPGAFDSMEKEMENSDGNLIQNDEESQKEQVEGGGPDSRVGIGNNGMAVERDLLAGMYE